MALIHIGNKTFELIHENRNGWNLEAFRDRYSEVLDRYDFIIGDWGYNQLRLKGLFRDNTQKATKDNTYSSVNDYINEYCNFGCAYFIIEKKHSGKQETDGSDEMDEDLQSIDLLDEQDKPAGGNSSKSEDSQQQRFEQADTPVVPAQEEERKKNDGDSSANGSRPRNQNAKGEPYKQKREFYYRKGQRFKKNSKSNAANEAAAAVEQP